MTMDETQILFPLGIEVIILNEDADGGDFSINNKGVVRGYDEEEYEDIPIRILIEFYDDVISLGGNKCGHSGNGDGKAGHCWYLKMSNIRINGSINVNSRIIL